MNWLKGAKLEDVEYLLVILIWQVNAKNGRATD
jgi:hypothetical protein